MLACANYAGRCDIHRGRRHPTDRADIARTAGYRHVAPLLGGRHKKRTEARNIHRGPAPPREDIAQTARKRPRKATWGQTWAKVQGGPMDVEAFIRKPAKLTGARHELCTWGEPTRPGGGSPSRKRHTQYVEHNRKGRLREQQENTGRGPIMEEVVCAMALKSPNGRQKYHTQTRLAHVFCELSGRRKALARRIHTGGSVRKTARARECNTSVGDLLWEGTFGHTAAFWLRRLVLCRPGAGWMIQRTACSPHAARCAHAVLACGPQPQYIISHCVTTHAHTHCRSASALHLTPA
jgi:hypothetical protein